MDLVQVDFCKRVPYDPEPSGFYYWTSVYYFDRDDFPSNGSVISKAQQFEHLFTTEDAKHVRADLKNPPGRGNIVASVTNFFGQGGAIDSEGSYTLLNIARWTLISDAGRKSYRLNRMPLRPSDSEGQFLSDSGYSQQLASLNTLLITGLSYNSHGELLVDGTVDRALHMWQLRDGTKRRARNPLAP
jgi:hypothetical protein